MAINLNHIDNSILIGTSETVRIASTGKVAIGGYGDPNSILDVRENKDGAETQIRLFNTDQGNTTTQTAALYLSPDIRGTALTGIRAIKENADFSTTAGRDVALTLNTLQNNSQQERLRIKSNGYVGIGSAVPETKLDVRGNINFQNSMLVSNWDSNGESGTNIDHIWHSDAANYGRGGTWNFVSDSAAKVTGNSSIQIGFLKSSGGGHLLGDVGIGTTNSQGKLHISSGTANSDCLLIIESDTDNNDENSNPQIWFKQDGGLNLGCIGQSSNTLVISNSVDNSGGISFRTGTTNNAGTTDPLNGSTERFLIASDGKVYFKGTTDITFSTNGSMGFNNSSPSSTYNIDMLNTVSAEGIRLRSTGSTYHDIVFDANRTAAANAIGRIVGKWNGNNVAIIQVQTGDDTTNKDDGRIRFYTSESGSNPIERMEIRNNGTVNIGGANEVQLDANNEEILYLHGAISGGADVDFAFGMRIDLDDDAGGTTTADRERGCALFQFSGNNAGGDTSNETRIWNIFSDVNCNEDYDNVYGLYSDIKTTHTSGTITTMRSVYGLAQNASSGSITEMIGVYGLAQTTNGANSLTISDLIGGKFRANMCAGSSTANATDVVAVWGNIDNDNNTAQPAGGKCALFYGSYDKTTGLSNPHGVYIATDVPNYFNGEVKLGTTTSAGKLTVDSGTSNTCATFQSSDAGAGINLKDNSARSSIEQNGVSLKISSDTGAEHANSDIRLQVDSATKMFINSDGEVGINNTNPLAGAKLDVRGVTFIADDIGDHQPSSWPNGTRQLIVYTSTDGQPIGNTACARVLIMTDAKQTGAQGYHGSIDFGSSDCSAANQTNEYNYRTAAIMCRGDGDTSSSVADGDLQFWTKSASGGLTHRFDIAPNGNLTGTDTTIGNLSDQRLKTNIQDFTYDLNKFKQLKTRTFDWINPEFHQEGNIRGFIAQEIDTVDNYWNYQYEVAKESCEKDYDLLDDGGEDYTIREHRPARASKLNGKDTMYVSVIQQLMAKIETLEAKVAALES